MCGSRYTWFITLFIALTCCIWLESSAAPVVENPRKPKAPNAGRVIVPEEVMTISGEGSSGHYFKHAWSPRVAPDGSLFVRTSSESDARQQLLMFDEAGRLVRNLEGPEPIGYSGYFLAGKNVVVFAESGYRAKLMWFNSAGIYQREITLPYEDCAGCWTPLAYFDAVFYFLYNRDSFPYDENTKPGIVDKPRRILSFAESSGMYTPLASLPTKYYFFGGQCNGGVCRGESTPISTFMSAPYQEKYFVLSHTREYLLKIYDPAANAVIREFRRDYNRIKNRQGKVESTIWGKLRTAPNQKYTPDIINIFTRGDEIWAVTSTRDEAKGVLIDIFDGNGIYKDSFYIKLPEQLLNALNSNSDSTIDGNTLYIITRDPNCVIRKFLIEK
jgi:hypothetical protein